MTITDRRIEEEILNIASNFVPYNNKGTVTSREIPATQLLEFTYHQPKDGADYNQWVQGAFDSLRSFTIEHGDTTNLKINDIKIYGDSKIPGTIKLSFIIDKNQLSEAPEELRDYDGWVKLGLFSKRLDQQILTMLENKVPPERISIALDKIVNELQAAKGAGIIPDAPDYMGKVADENVCEPMTTDKRLAQFHKTTHANSNALINMIGTGIRIDDEVSYVKDRFDTAMIKAKREKTSVFTKWLEEMGIDPNSYPLKGSFER